MIVKLVDGITKALPQIVPAIIKGITLFITSILKELPKIIKAGLDMLVALVKGIIDAIPMLIDALPEIITAFVNYFITNIGEIIKTGIELIIALAVGLVKAIPQLVMKLPEIIGAIVVGLLQGVASMGEIGLELIKGLWEGIKNAGKWLYDKITGWVSEVFGWIKGLFGISSPSKLMRDEVGKWIPRGLADGISENAKYVDDAMEDMMPDLDSQSYDMDINRKFNDSVYRAPVTNTIKTDIDNRAIDKIVKGIKAAISDKDTVIILNDREFGRAVRKAVPAV